MSPNLWGTPAVLYQLNYQANWELINTSVHDNLHVEDENHVKTEFQTEDAHNCDEYLILARFVSFLK